jgi:pimeloyl-ACP methyl ester carboxylesterase
MGSDADGVPARWARATTPKFAYPLVILPELFTTFSHLSLLSGYLASVGWDVCMLAPYAGIRDRRLHLTDLCALVARTISALDREVIVLGHGLGGLLAFALEERVPIAAAVSIAPALPGFRSPLLGGFSRRWAAVASATLPPPAGRVLLEFVADADRFQRRALIDELTPGDVTPLHEVVRGAIDLKLRGKAPRLIVTGNEDIFAPYHRVVQFAETCGAQFATLAGCGHWIVGGRALEKTVGEIQRFLIKNLGSDLLLLYPQE